MANYNSLKTAIKSAVDWNNNNNEISGNDVLSVLLTMVNSLGVGYQYVAIATPATNPGTPDQNVFYIASTAGTYANFNGLIVSDNELAILKYNGSWSKQSIGIGDTNSILALDNKIAELFLETALLTERTSVRTYSGYKLVNITGDFLQSSPTTDVLIVENSHSSVEISTSLPSDNFATTTIPCKENVELCSTVVVIVPSLT